MRPIGRASRARRPAAGTGADYYVSVSAGSDSNDGLTAATPWQTMAKARDTVPTGEEKLVYVRAGTYPALSIINKTRTAFLRFKAYPGESVTLEQSGPGVTERAVYLSNSHFFSFEGFLFTGGAYVYAESSNVQFLRNDFQVQQLRLRRCADVLIEGNVMHNYQTGTSMIASAGAAGESGLVRVTIRGNELYDGVYDAMAIYWKLTDVVIEGNYVHDINRPVDSTDHTDGIQIAPQSEGGLRTIVRNNRVIRCFQGLFIKDGPHVGLEVYNNVVMERLSSATAFSLYDSPNARVVNNTFANCWLRGTGIYPASTDLVFENNLSAADITAFSGWGGSFAVERNNLAASYAGFTPAGSDIIGSPTFVGLADDYRLASGSAGIDAGVSDAYMPVTDLGGRVRPVGSQPDIGAYERQAGDP